MLRSSTHHIIKLLSCYSSLNSIAVAGIRALPTAQRQQNFNFLCAPALRHYSDAPAQAPPSQSSNNLDSTQSDTSIAAADDLAQKNAARMLVLSEFVDWLLLPAPQTREETKEQKTKLLAIVEDFKSNTLTGKHFMAHLASVVPNASLVDQALAMYINMTTFGGNQSDISILQRVFSRSQPWNKSVGSHINRIRTLLPKTSNEQQLHYKTLFYLIRHVIESEQKHCTIFTYHVMRGLLQALLERNVKHFSEAEKTMLISMIFMLLHKLNPKDTKTIFYLATRAQGRLNDAQEMHDKLLRFLYTELLEPEENTVLAVLGFIRSFEQRFINCEIDSQYVYDLYVKANRIKSSPEAKQRAEAAVRDYFFVERPRRKVTANVLVTLSNYDLDLCLEILDTIDPIEMEQVMWDGRIIFNVITVGIERNDDVLVRDIVLELIRRKNSGVIDMTQLPYVLIRTEKQRQLLQSLATQVETVLKKFTETTEKDIENWRLVVKEQLAVKLDSSGPGKGDLPRLQIVPLAETEFLVKLQRQMVSSQAVYNSYSEEQEQKSE